MVEQGDIFIKSDEVSTLSSMLIGANAENTQSFVYPNFGTLLAVAPDFPYQSRIWIEDKCIITHGKRFDCASTLNVSYSGTIMPWTYNGMVVKKKVCKVMDAMQDSYATNIKLFLNEPNAKNIYLLKMEGYILDYENGGTKRIDAVMELFGEYGGEVTAVKFNNSSYQRFEMNTEFIVTYAITYEQPR